MPQPHSTKARDDCTTQPPDRSWALFGARYRPQAPAEFLEASSTPEGGFLTLSRAPATRGRREEPGGPSPSSARSRSQSSSFSRQVSSEPGCRGSARAAQTRGRSWEHSRLMANLRRARATNQACQADMAARPRPPGPVAKGDRNHGDRHHGDARCQRWP